MQIRGFDNYLGFHYQGKRPPFVFRHRPDSPEDVPNGGPAKADKPADDVAMPPPLPIETNQPPNLVIKITKPRLMPQGDGPVIDLEREITFIGRHIDCDKRIDHDKMSRKHCVVIKLGKQVVIRDLGSTNGVYINDSKIDVTFPLNHNDKVQIGAYTYTFETPEAQDIAEVNEPVQSNVSVKLAPLGGGELISIVKDVTIIGRKEHCDIRPDHPSISKAHLVLVKTQGLLLFRDLCSTNGTKVNGQRVIRGALLPNDKLSLGKVKFTVQIKPEDQTEMGVEPQASPQDAAGQNLGGPTAQVNGGGEQAEPPKPTNVIEGGQAGSQEQPNASEAPPNLRDKSDEPGLDVLQGLADDEPGAKSPDEQIQNLDEGGVFEKPAELAGLQIPRSSKAKRIYNYLCTVQYVGWFFRFFRY